MRHWALLLLHSDTGTATNGTAAACTLSSFLAIGGQLLLLLLLLLNYGRSVAPPDGICWWVGFRMCASFGAVPVTTSEGIGPLCQNGI
jgi:hypothetical protein